MSIYQERAKECKCCGKHVPLPTVLKEYNGTPLCPTTFSNVIEYKRIWKYSMFVFVMAINYRCLRYFYP